MNLRLIAGSIAVVVAAAVALAVPVGTRGVAAGGDVAASVHGYRAGATPAATLAWPSTATWNKADHDGKAFSIDQPDLTSLPQVHVVYIHASDKPSRFQDFAAMFQAQNRRTSQQFAGVISRGVRWDERLAGGVRYHDITVLKSDARFSRMNYSTATRDLSRAKLNDPNKKYLVWQDAPDGRYCGQAGMAGDTQRNASNASNKSSVAVIFTAYDRTNATGGWCFAQMHELSHAFGAVQPSAPNYQGWHCNDNGNDVLCYYASGVPYDGTDLRYYDWKNDDYADAQAVPGYPDSVEGTPAPKLAWWTVNLSRFLCAKSTDPDGLIGCDQPATPEY